MSKIDIFLNLTGTLLAIALASILIWRKLYKEFPFFFAYISSSILIAIARISADGNYLTFFKVVWATEAMYVLLALLALHEVFRWVFLAFFKKSWFWLFFPSTFAAISTLAAVYHFRALPAQANQVINLILSFGMAVNWVQAGLFVLFFALVWFHGIRWRDYPFGIVVGFAVIAIGSLGARWARSEFGTKFNFLASYAPAVAYIFAVVLWLITFIRPPELEPEWRLNMTPEQMLHEVQQYTKIIERFLRRQK
ncbi:MAG TPA: hypothetical protein VG488_08415 [Candidatus Angelobacter sp.]|jgi:hypothetical protein|nr:hypothetical protein [Candidatus Angelobacter sp.]